MLKSKTIPVFFNIIYRKKINKFILFYNPYSYKGLTLINIKYHRIIDSIDGKNSLEVIYQKNKALIDKQTLFSLIRNLRDYDIINTKNDKKEFKLKISDKRLKDDYSLTIWLQLTNQCNFRCTYCFVSKSKEEIREETIDKLLNRLAFLYNKKKIKTFRLFFAGGEPLLRFPMIQKIINKINKFKKTQDLPICYSIITNGSLVTEKVASYLKENNFTVGISLDGLGKVQNRTRKFVDGSGTFEYAEKGLKIIQKYGILSNIVTTITKKNISDLTQLVDYCLKNNISITMQFFKKLNEYCNEDLVKDEKQIVKSYLKAIKKIYKYYELNKIADSPLKNNILLDHLKILGNPFYEHCLAGLNYFSLYPDETIRFCPSSETTVANINDNDFLDKARKNTLEMFNKATSDDIKECQNCPWRYICAGGCKLERLYVNKLAPTIKCRIYKKIIPIIIGLEAKRLIGLNLLLFFKS